MPLLGDMKTYSAASLLLGLLFGIIIMLFVVISVLLIYSLLMIAVETKTFQNGVMRMLGISKSNSILIVFIQSLCFVIPSILVGYLASIPALLYLFQFIFKGEPEVQVAPIPTGLATLQAVILGLLIPLVSSIVPIQTSMNKQISESISLERSKSTKGMKVTIQNESSFQAKLPLILFGSIASISGVAIYFFLPLSVLTLNLALLFEIFFLILIGIILGLTLIAFNFQRALELCLVNTLLVLEKKSMKQLIVKNLSAHRASNRLTSLIFTLTLGTILFIIVQVNLQIQMLSSASFGEANYLVASL